MKGKKQELKAQLDEAKQKRDQAENRVRILENKQRAMMKKEDNQRTHHLCNMGGAIQSISKDADALTKTEFFSLMEKVFALPQVQTLVQEAKEAHDGGIC
ncbi:MAG: DUF3847 domain-containing protein [Negativibacillus massiliensis]|nr:DUF3847 domain-containing protein [Negativibacillus massiliensis]